MYTLSQKKTDSEIAAAKYDKVMNSVERWASFYRSNPQRFALDYLSIHLKKFQQIILCAMFWCTNLIYLASRGGSKTFMLAIFSVIYCILYPGTTIKLASKTRGQAKEVIDKIQTILMPKSANLRHEIEEVQTNQVNSFVKFKNTSRISVVTAGENARHNRATILITDEFVKVDKNIIDTILKKFLTDPRRPGFMDKPEYADYPPERNKELYASSCWYESHWSYEKVRSFAANMISGRKYFVCALPYQLAIREKLLSREQVEDEMSESTFNEVSFYIEMQSLFFGESNGGLFSYEDIARNRKIKYSFYPRSTNCKIVDKRVYIPLSKQPGEIRLLSADIALMASSSKSDNDATSIIINQMLPTSNESRYTSNIVYLENNEGLRTEEQALVIRKMFEDYSCDYLILDVKGLGIGIVDALTADIYDPNTGKTYEALSCCNNEVIAARCKVKNAPKKIWAIQGSLDFNSRCALNLREGFRVGKIRIPISEYDAEEVLQELQGYSKLPVEDKIFYQMPYINATLLVNELVNLQYKIINGNDVQVKEKGGMRKDRYSSLCYNYFVANCLEREKISARQRKDNNDLVIQIKAPQLRKKY